ncbi:MAG: YraN family protein, partial [Selenomonas sp.]|nr:YraN family protein [Selenomonas sp.]
MKNQILGSQGEQAAADFLQQQGYKICARNFRVPVGEIDIIARQGEVLAFVEVKTR